MKIGLLQAGHLAEPIQDAVGGNYDHLYTQMLAPFGIETQNWAVVDGIFPDSIDAMDGWLIGGSKFGVYEDLDWIDQLEDFTRAVYAAKKPIVGICFGHQLIAQALGGRVEKFDGGWNVGSKDYALDHADWTLNAWHQDQVLTPPPGAKVLGNAANCDIAFLDYGNGAISVQPHPEFGVDAVQSLIDVRRGVVPDDLLDTAQDKLSQGHNNDAASAWIASRLKEAAHV